MDANLKVAELKCHINGRFVGSSRQFAKINPVDGTVVAQVHEADRAMVDEAVRSAKAALKGPWASCRCRRAWTCCAKSPKASKNASMNSFAPRWPTRASR